MEAPSGFEPQMEVVQTVRGRQARWLRPIDETLMVLEPVAGAPSVERVTGTVDELADARTEGDDDEDRNDDPDREEWPCFSEALARRRQTATAGSLSPSP